MKRILGLIVVLVLSCVPPLMQAQDRGRMNMPPGENVVGKVTAVSKDSLTVSPLSGGESVTVKIGDSTRVMKQRQPVKLEEIKAGDTVFARGELNNKVMQAAVVSLVTPEMVQRLQQGGGFGGANAGGGFNRENFNREDLGKKFIAGEVKAINETRLTIARSDGQTQEIEVDENTSFKKGNESITLPDIKAGDFVRGRGELKDNIFVPKELIVGRPQMRMTRGGQGSQTQEQQKPDTATPSPSTPPAASPK
jgi:preprotein translocase subunit YajC